MDDSFKLLPSRLPIQGVAKDPVREGRADEASIGPKNPGSKRLEEVGFDGRDLESPVSIAIGVDHPNRRIPLGNPPADRRLPGTDASHNTHNHHNECSG
jgi:hypothetical protein